MKEVTVILINSSGVDFKAHLLLYKIHDNLRFQVHGGSRPRVHLAVPSRAISAGQTYNRPESHSHISAKSSAHRSNHPILRPSAGPMSWLITTTLMISVAKGCVQGAAKLCCTSKGIGLANLFLHPISTSNQCSRVFRLFARKIAPPTPSPKSHQPGATDRLDLYKLGRFFGSSGLRDPPALTRSSKCTSQLPVEAVDAGEEGHQASQRRECFFFKEISKSFQTLVR